MDDQHTLPAVMPPPTWAGTDAQSSSTPFVRPLSEHRAGLVVLLAAAGGLIGQLLFFGQRLGINVPLWIALVIGCAYFARPSDARLARSDAWLPVAAITFALFVALRAEVLLGAFDLAAAGVLTLLSVIALGGHSVSQAALRPVADLFTRGALLFVCGAAFVAHGLRPLLDAFGRRSSDSTAWRVARGALVAVPLVFVFVAIFSAADAVFGALVRDVVAIDLSAARLPGRLVLAALAAWLLAGTFVAAWLWRAEPSPVPVAPVASARRGSIEALVVLLALDATFALFVLLQATYLFGGLDTLAISGMTYSEYARRGFFELIVAALMAGMVLIVLAHFVGGRGRSYRLAAALLVVLTAVVITSALYRLSLYQQAYGWTELRFYVLAAIAWLALGAAATLAAVVRDRVQLLPKIALGLGLLVALACNAVGPQEFVVQQNIERAIHPELVAPGGRTGLDVYYLLGLDAGAMAVLASSLERLPELERNTVEETLFGQKERLQDAVSAGWPSWNLARQTALEALVAAGY